MEESRVYRGILGAIIGDIVGRPFEFHNKLSTDFALFSELSRFSDDTVTTIAVANWLLKEEPLVDSLRSWARRYPRSSWGKRFFYWLFADQPQPPYNSFGNGSAMRVSPCGYVAQSLEEALALSKESAEVTHNHPEGIKGAQAIAIALFLARNKASKKEIKEYITHHFDYDLTPTCEDLRKNSFHSETCQETCPRAIIAFLESQDYESSLRLAISIGGDSDTIAAMTGGISAAYYGIPEQIVERARKYLPADILEVVERFDKEFVSSRQQQQPLK